MEENINIVCLEVSQPIGKYYIGVMSWQNLLKIARKDIERIRNDEKDGTYFGIQRGLSSKRLNEIAQYVSFKDATFPSSVVLSIDTIYYDEENDKVSVNIIKFEKNILELNSETKSVKIIDGQHRVFGLEKYVNENPIVSDNFNFDLIVTIFIDIDEEDESNIFAIINKAQTRVNNSLVYDLYDLAKTRSPQRTAHNIVKLLNEEEASPLFRQIKRLGISETKNETIAQATIVDSILRYISTNPSLDRDLLIKGKKLSVTNRDENKKLFFRQWFIEGKDENIASVVWNYFSAIKNQWPEAWKDKTKILAKSTGIIAFMRFLKNIINHFGGIRIITEEEFRGILVKIKLEDEDFINDKYKAGGVGQSDLYKDLMENSAL
jgi:DGQHR domain-containing protein